MTLDAILGYASDHAKGYTTHNHTHVDHQIAHASDGVMRVYTETANWIIPPGRALWIPARTEHGIQCLTDVSMRMVYLSGDIKLLPEECEVWAISALMREIIIRIANGANALELPHLAALLICEIETKNVLPLHVKYPRDRRALKVAQAIIDTPANALTLEVWAQQAGASTRTLKRLFKAETGLTFRQWRRQVRTVHALELLAKGVPVTNVAMAVGYDSVSAFIEMFRNQLGTTPGKYFDDRE